MDYSARLKLVAFRPDWFACSEVKRLCEALKSTGIPFVFCGGAVRDAIDNRKAPKDFDIFANASAESIRNALIDYSIDADIIPPYKVAARMGKAAFDFFTRPPSEDADAENWLSPEALRDKMVNFDFTINTLILTPEGELYDFFDAVSDIREKRVRCVVDPVESITRGAVRILRYFRFCAEYDDLGGDEYALEAFRHHRNHIIPSSDKDKNHIRIDMFALLAAPRVSNILSLMKECDVLSYACGSEIKNLTPITTLSQMEETTPSSERIMSRIMALLMGSSLSPLTALESFAGRLDLPEALKGKIKSLLNLLPYIEPSMTREKRLGLIAILDESSLETLLMLRCASEVDGERAKELYLSLLQTFSSDGYASGHMAGLYTSMRGGYSPYGITHYYGFTLIEMSVVLVIIGLIVGGVLVGRDLIKAAEIRSTITQLEKYNSAVNTFRGKYGCLPGDCNQGTAQQFGLSSTIPINSCWPQYPGDGNGIIGVSKGDTGCGDAELIFFWQQLKDAGLFADQTTQVLYQGVPPSVATIYNSIPALKFSAVSPTSGLPAGISVFPGILASNNGVKVSTDHLFWITSAIGDQPIVHTVGASVLFPSDAFKIDQKIDDGLPLQGTVQAAGESNANGPTPVLGTGATDCVNSNNAYNITLAQSTTNGLCSLVIKAAF